MKSLFPLVTRSLAPLCWTLLAACGENGGGAAQALDPPAAFTGGPEQAAAARFLGRASFGASPASVSELLALGPEGWIDAQLALPPTKMLPALADLGCANELPGAALPCPPPYPQAQRALRDALWWEHATFAPDQLRQRVAFAWSQILVASEKNAVLFPLPLMVADYHDLLVEHAFGDFRTLLEEVTLHPAMGAYLSMVKNRAADPELGTQPDENYAREVMQLFTIGLVELAPDGTPLLDAEGQPIPTYDQQTIREVARVLTGWNYASDDPSSADLEIFLDVPPKLGRMEPWPAFHDYGSKELPGGGFAPAGLSPEADLDLLLDVLAEHPNVGPFLSRQLIQRLSTSNPSPGYVARVAAVWADDGTGQRGNLAAVVRAILLDPEAGWQATGPDDAFEPTPTAGKLREPILRITALWRAFDADLEPYDPFDPPIYPNDELLGQKALSAPSVFNFFSPDHTTTALAEQGLVAPELQITTHDKLVEVALQLDRMVSRGNTTVVDQDWRLPRIDLTPLLAVADDPEALVELIALRLTGGTLAAGTAELVADYVAELPLDDPPAQPGYRRATRALALVSLAPDGALQR